MRLFDPESFRKSAAHLQRNVIVNSVHLHQHFQLLTLFVLMDFARLSVYLIIILWLGLWLLLRLIRLYFIRLAILFGFFFIYNIFPDLKMDCEGGGREFGLIDRLNIGYLSFMIIYNR